LFAYVLKQDYIRANLVHEVYEFSKSATGAVVRVVGYNSEVVGAESGVGVSPVIVSYVLFWLCASLCV
jgi:hypothetical protein